MPDIRPIQFDPNIAAAGSVVSASYTSIDEKSLTSNHVLYCAHCKTPMRAQSRFFKVVPTDTCLASTENSPSIELPKNVTFTHAEPPAPYHDAQHASVEAHFTAHPVLHDLFYASSAYGAHPAHDIQQRNATHIHVCDECAQVLKNRAPTVKQDRPTGHLAPAPSSTKHQAYVPIQPHAFHLEHLATADASHIHDVPKTPSFSETLLRNTSKTPIPEQTASPVETQKTPSKPHTTTDVKHILQSMAIPATLAHAEINLEARPATEEPHIEGVSKIRPIEPIHRHPQHPDQQKK